MTLLVRVALLIAACFSANVYAEHQTVKLVEASYTGKTVRISRDDNVPLKEGTVVVLRTNLVKVASGRVVRLEHSTAILRLLEIFNDKERVDVGTYEMEYDDFKLPARAVVRLQDKYVLFIYEEYPMVPGDQFVMVDQMGNTYGRIKAVSIKASVAWGEIMEGQAKPGLIVLLDNVRRLPEEREPPSRWKSDSFGITPEINYINFRTNVAAFDSYQSRNTVAHLQGAGPGLMFYYDHPIAGVGLRFLAGTTQYNGHDHIFYYDCDNGPDCDFKGTYAHLGGQLDVNLFRHREFHLWSAFGFSKMVLLSVKGTAFNNAHPKINFLFRSTIGADVPVGLYHYVPIQLEYDRFPSSTSVNAFSIVFRIGYAWCL